ncbi:YbhB/YbcL family Raf kinase inhibitor-like protein [Micromonospora pisi]|uniref:YbhB/YbcL family Raf kinase inhibitor-like protein n=1 Tax=Micromonospora pisi TaxID=589240 RepID=UPI001476DC0E|nr:YbhB/YbcL family Raf kinase inhibitor-like protein [Micromonospora pisi]
MTRTASLIVLVVVASLLTGCGQASPVYPMPTVDPKVAATPTTVANPTPAANPARTITVTSSVFAEGERIPERYTCNGGSERPPLAWSGDVGEAVAFALIVDDPDAPGFTYVHWIAYDIPATSREIPAGDLPADLLQASNSAGGPTWAPPCPPSGVHHYQFTVYALKQKIGLSAGTEAGEARKAIEAAAIRTGTLTGLYGNA